MPDGGSEEERAELIAQRLRERKSAANHSEHRSIGLRRFEASVRRDLLVV
jgi:hypothetical protein